jgi:aminoglycoside phosphotransferase (APT) family kinase protein
MPDGNTPAVHADVEREITSWIQDTLGVTVTSLERIPRWRAGWYVDATTALGDQIRLYARGERGEDFLSPFTLDHEARVHRLLAESHVRVPKVLGVLDTVPRVLVMERLPGVQGLAHASCDSARVALFHRWIEELVTIHNIEIGDAERFGFRVDDTVFTELYVSVEDKYTRLTSKHGRDPIIEFFAKWLRINRPAGLRPAFVTWDSAQFLHDDDALVALIDFEMAHLGNIYMDFAALRTRDSMEPLGDIMGAIAYYEELTGSHIDLDVLRYFEIAQLTVTLMLQYPVLHEPHPDSDYVTHLMWYVESARYACEILAELHAVDLPTLEPPPAAPLKEGPAFHHLVRSLHSQSRSEPPSDLVRYGIALDGAIEQRVTATADPFAGWRMRCAYRLARHLLRTEEIGAQLEADNDDDVRALVARATDSDATTSLLEHLDTSPFSDADVLALVGLVNRRAQRLHMSLGPAASLLVRHPRLQHLVRSS